MLPPPPSRHRAILWLRRPAPLFDMREQNHNNTSVNAILTSAVAATPLLFVDVISTDRSHTTCNPLIQEINAKFYGRSTCRDDRVCFETKLAVPTHWSPRLFLATINKSIQQHTIISLDNVDVSGVAGTIINETFLKFSWSAQHVKELYSTLNIEGGELNFVSI